MKRKLLFAIIGIIGGLFVIYLVLVASEVLNPLQNSYKRYVKTPSGIVYEITDYAMPIEDLWIKWFILGEEIEKGEPASDFRYENYRFYAVKGDPDQKTIYVFTDIGRLMKGEIVLP